LEKFNYGLYINDIVFYAYVYAVSEYK